MNSCNRDSCLYVGNLAAEQTTLEEIDCLFWAFGELVDCRLGPHGTHAIVEYGERSAADLAMSCLNGRQLHGNALVMAFHDNEQADHKKRVPKLHKKKITVPEGKSKTNLYVTNLSKNVTENDLETMFSTVGTVEKVRVFFGKHSKEHLGTGCVQMSSIEEAQEAIDKFHETELEGQPMKIDRALEKDSRPSRNLYGYGMGSDMQSGLKRPSSPYNRESKRPRSDTSNVFCKNLPQDYTEKELSELFCQHGEVEATRIFIGQITGKPLGTACVRMREREEAAAAIEALDKLNIDGHTIKVEWALDKKEKRKENPHSHSHHSYHSYHAASPRRRSTYDYTEYAPQYSNTTFFEPSHHYSSGRRSSHYKDHRY